MKFKAGVKSQLKRLAEKNKYLLFLVRKNDSIDVSVVTANKGYFFMDDAPRLVSDYHVFLLYGKFPTIILPEWDIEPKKRYIYNEKVGLSKADVAKLIYAVAKSDENSGKKPINKKVLVFVILGLLVLLWLLFGGSGGG